MLQRLNEEIGVPDSNPSSSEVISFYDFMNSRSGIDVQTEPLPSLVRLVPLEKRKDFTGKNEKERGYILHDLFETFIKRESANLTIMGYPSEITILSKRMEQNPSLSEEFRMFVKGRSFCYGCTELTDPEEQQSRISEQIKQWKKETKDLDDGFLEALKIGIPPCAGLGLSLQRLQSIYLNKQDVRDVILFPLT